MMSSMPKEQSALDKWIEDARRDDSLRRHIERMQEGNNRLRRLVGIPERRYPPYGSEPGDAPAE